MVLYLGQCGTCVRESEHNVNMNYQDLLNKTMAGLFIVANEHRTEKRKLNLFNACELLTSLCFLFLVKM